MRMHVDLLLQYHFEKHFIARQGIFDINQYSLLLTHFYIWNMIYSPQGRN